MGSLYDAGGSGKSALVKDLTTLLKVQLERAKKNSTSTEDELARARHLAAAGLSSTAGLDVASCLAGPCFAELKNTCPIKLQAAINSIKSAILEELGAENVKEFHSSLLIEEETATNASNPSRTEAFPTPALSGLRRLRNSLLDLLEDVGAARAQLELAARLGGNLTTELGALKVLVKKHKAPPPTTLEKDSDWTKYFPSEVVSFFENEAQR